MNRYIEGLISALSFFTIIPFSGNYKITGYTMYFFTFTGPYCWIDSRHSIPDSKAV